MKAPGALLLSNKSPNKAKLGFEGFERTERGVRVGGGRPADWPPGLRCLRSTLPRLLRHPHTLHQPLLQTPVPGQASINQARTGAQYFHSQLSSVICLVISSQKITSKVLMIRSDVAEGQWKVCKLSLKVFANL